MLNREERSVTMPSREPDMHTNATPLWDASLDDTSPEDDNRWLLSLALDGQLDEAEAAELERLLASDPALQAEWQTWQTLDEAFRHAPFVAPPVDFVANFETRLVQMERRKRLWAGTIIGLAALMLWGSGIAGLVALSALMVNRQGAWLNDVLHGLALWWLNLTTTIGVLWTTVLAVLATPQAQAAVVSYGLAVALVLALWLGFLRRSIRSSATAPVSSLGG